jgi:type I restriction enzyme S subunit
MLSLKRETEFKNTEFGKIPKDWEIAILGDESKFAVIMGQSPSSKYYNQEGRGNLFAQGKKEFGDLYITPTIFTTKCSKNAPPNSVLISVRAPVGELNLTKSELCIGRGIAAILNKSGNPLHNRFMYYALKTLSEYLQILGERGTTYDSVRKEELDNVSFPYPSCSEQERITSVLSWFDDLIENKKRQNEILENIAMAIFKSWFMYFEPFKSSAFVDSELGKIPEGWGIKRVSDVADIFLGGTPRREVDKYWNGTIKWASAKDIASTQGLFILETAENISQEGLDHSNAKILPQNSIVITARGTVGEIRLLGDAITFNQTCYGLVPKNDMNSYYLFLSLRRIIAEIKALSYGTVFDTITMRNFDEMKISIPPNLILEKFHSIVEPLFQKILLNQKQIMILRKVRDVLLPLLVFGKLRVEEI